MYKSSNRLVHHFPGLSVSLHITSYVFVFPFFFFLLFGVSTLARPPVCVHALAYAHSSQPRCRSARACYRYSQCLSLCKRAALLFQVTFDVPVDSVHRLLLAFMYTDSRQETNTHTATTTASLPFDQTSERSRAKSRVERKGALLFCFIN